MYRLPHKTRIFLGCICFMLLGDALCRATDVIRINGSGTSLEMLKPLIRAYEELVPGVEIYMEKPLGSAGAIRALLAGRLDIASTARELKPEEIALGARLRLFGRTPMAIIAGSGVSVRSVSIRELEDIYSGKMLYWPDGKRIRVILRPNEDTDTRILRGLSPGMSAAIDLAQRREGMIVGVTDPESNEAVMRIEGSIGASGLAGVVVENLPVHIMALEGVMPSVNTLKSGAYPMAKRLDFVTTVKISGPAADFLKFIYSRQGRGIVEKYGVLPDAE